MKKWWVSWYDEYRFGDFELHFPWWISGVRGEDNADMICAALMADTEEAAIEIVYAVYDKRPDAIEFRFVEGRPDDWSPFCGRFPKADWMAWYENIDDKALNCLTCDKLCNKPVFNIKLGVSGSRLCFDYDKIKEDILREFRSEDLAVIISGGAKGVDALCERFASEHGIPIESHKPDYDRHGKGAPLVRNREIVDSCDVLMAWPLWEPKSGGTVSTMEYAKAKGIRVIENRVDLKDGLGG